MSDVTFDMASNAMAVLERHAEPWQVTLVDTGDATQTGGRLKRITKFVQNDEAFCATYGDGVADVDIAALIVFHREQGLKATVTANLPARPLRRAGGRCKRPRLGLPGEAERRWRPDQRGFFRKIRS